MARFCQLLLLSAARPENGQSGWTLKLRQVGGVFELCWLDFDGCLWRLLALGRPRLTVKLALHGKCHGAAVVPYRIHLW